MLPAPTIVTGDGVLWGMGNNEFAQLGNSNPEDIVIPIQIATGVVAIEAGFYNSYFLKEGGMLWGVGYSEFGQLGGSSTENRSTPAPIAEGVVSFDGGYGHLAFVKEDGTLWTMGNNEYGQLGDGSTTNRNVPVQVAANVVSVATGEHHTQYITADGTLWGMGSNEHGSLGDSSNVDRHAPVVIATGVSSVAAAWNRTLFWKDIGSLYSTTPSGTHQRMDINFATAFDGGVSHTIILTPPPANTCSFGEWIDAECDQWVSTGTAGLGWIYYYSQGDSAWISVPSLGGRHIYIDLSSQGGAWLYVPAIGENSEFTGDAGGEGTCGFAGYSDPQCDGWINTGAAMLGWTYYQEAGSSGWINLTANCAWYYLGASDANGAWLFMPY